MKRENVLATSEMIRHDITGLKLEGSFRTPPNFSDLDIIKIEISQDTYTDNLNETIETLIRHMEKFPESDSLLITKDAVTPEMQMEADKILAEGIREREGLEKCTCDDPGCPYKAKISPLAYGLSRMILNSYTTNLSFWEPFRYPVFDFGDMGGMSMQSLQAICSFKVNENTGKRFGSWRVMTDFILRPSPDGKFLYAQVPRYTHFIEAVITDRPFTLTSNDSKILFEPRNNYCFIGMLPIVCSHCSLFQINMEGNEPVTVRVISHIINDGRLEFEKCIMESKFVKYVSSFDITRIEN